MILSSNNRADFFGSAYNLSPMLGKLFQNPTDLTTEEIQKEIDDTRKLLEHQKKTHNDYIWKLGELLCFPEKFKP